MIEAWLSSAARIVQVALGIGFVIFVHELGHFLVAKRAGVRVDVFSLGFGPRLLGFRRGPTDYRLSAIPLGGYVRMAGEGPDEPASGAADEFASKSVGARAAVIVAGVVMNAIFAVLMFLVAFKVGVRMQEPAVGRVAAGSAAEAAGLRYGDRVLSVDGTPVLEFMDLGLAAAYATGPLDLVVDRRGERLEIRVTPRKSPASPVQQLGFERLYAVHSTAPGSAAAAAGLAPGDWLLGVDGRPARSDADVVAAIRASAGETITLDVRRADGRLEKVPLTPSKRPARGFGMTLRPWPVALEVVEGSAAAAAGLRAGDAIVEIDGAPADVATFRETIESSAPGAALRVVVLRADGGAREELSITPRVIPTDPHGGRKIGVGFGCAVVADVAAGSPAALAGIRAGDRIAEVDGRAPRYDRTDFLDLLANDASTDPAPLALKLVRTGAGEPMSVSLVPAVVEGRFLGDAGLELAKATFVHRAPGLIEPIRLGFERTLMFAEQVILTFRGMFARRIDTSTLGGPIGIAETAYRVSEDGLGKLLYFLAIISVNLAVLNILPIPILDGGHLVFLGIEKLKGGPVPVSVQSAAQWAGLVLLLALMVFVTKNDIVRLIGS